MQKSFLFIEKGSPQIPPVTDQSHISVFSKIFEKLMDRRLHKFVDGMDAFYPLQSGFRERHSANNALISMTETIRNNIDNGNYMCGVFIDLKKAFHKVTRSILLKEMEHYGVRGIALNWFASHLSNRKQHVSVNGCL